jgi:nucleotide-binding universal stress UspA family protein
MKQRGAQAEKAPVLVAIGHDDNSPALEFGAAVARREGCELHLLHVVRAGTLAPETAEVVFNAAHESGAGIIRTAARRAHELTGDAVPVTTELAHAGPVADFVLARSARARMVVLTRRDTSRLERFATGSTTGAVASRAPAPVVIVPPGWAAVESLHDVVTVGIDHIENASALLRPAFDVARARGSLLRVVHAWWMGNGLDRLVDQASVRDWNKRVASALETSVDAVRRDFEGVNARVVCRHQRPAQELLDASRGSGLMLIGRRDPRLPVRSHLGPVARVVARESACPVMVVEHATVPATATAAEPAWGIAGQERILVGQAREPHAS